MLLAPGRSATDDISAYYCYACENSNTPPPVVHSHGLTPSSCFRGQMAVVIVLRQEDRSRLCFQKGVTTRMSLLYLVWVTTVTAAFINIF